VNGDLLVFEGSKLVDPEGRIYELRRHIGSGNFGQVYEAVLTNPDSGPPSPFAVKISKSDPRAVAQFDYESQVLSFLATQTKALQVANVLSFERSFVHECHACIVSELLGPSLLAELDRRGYEGLPLSLIQPIILDCLRTLSFLASEGLVHCDVKPENILFAGNGHPSVKIVDFGSCCRAGDAAFTYVQSRYYRAPEVVLEAPIGPAVDVWSLGCVAAELMLGLPLFPAVSQLHLIVLINEMLGPFPPSMARRSRCFAGDGTLKDNTQLQLEFGEDFSHFQRYFIQARLDEIVMSFSGGAGTTEQEREAHLETRRLFLDLLNNMLELDPERRISADDARVHPFFQRPI
jgi:dual specificity protein kinase YAK1